MEKENLQLALEKQREFFRSGKTADQDFRIQTLKKLRSIILEFESEIVDALWKDFHKPRFEVIATESRFVIKELNMAIRKMKRWSKPEKVWTPLVHFLSWSYIEPRPYGQVLILSPWNYPFQLAFVPLIGALAAGNCVVLKVSRQVPHITGVMEKILARFPAELVMMMNGDHAVSEFLLSQKFDYIFFTGSSKTGKYVMGKAAENLIPVSLELSGKNPCVVADDAPLEYAARRIIWGKFLNAGQTCICSDYLLVDRKIKDRLLALMKKEIEKFYGRDPSQSPDFSRIINEENVKRLAGFLQSGHVAAGGMVDEKQCFVSPTILNNVQTDDAVMQEEVFGPVLPVLDFNNFDEVYGIINSYPKPLAVYIFSRSKTLIRGFLRRTQSGTAGVNDTVMQIASPYLPYGGVGNSGMGRYHGKKSFETFSNMRSVLVKSSLFDIPLRYPPYNRFKEKVLSLLLR
jgi:aldehyde dehydrogenase (NAD+)